MSNLLIINTTNDKDQIYKTLLKNYGIGKHIATDLCNYLGVCKKFKVQDLTTEQIEELEKKIFRSQLHVNQNLKKIVSKNFETALNIKSYKGIRKVKGYPANGQRTRSNAKTARKKRFF